MNEPTIGQRLFEMHVKNADRSLKVWKWENEPLLDQKAWNDSATALLRGVLTGEIPLPDELVKAGYFVGHINPESIACDALESFEGSFTHHIPDVTK